MQNVTSQYFFCCQAGRRPMEEEMRIWVNGTGNEDSRDGKQFIY